MYHKKWVEGLGFGVVGFGVVGFGTAFQERIRVLTDLVASTTKSRLVHCVSCPQRSNHVKCKC